MTKLVRLIDNTKNKFQPVLFTWFDFNYGRQKNFRFI